MIIWLKERVFPFYLLDDPSLSLWNKEILGESRICDFPKWEGF
jgi:hypothetical protein